MWSIVDEENISKQIVIDLFDGVETDLEEKVVISSKKDLLSCDLLGLKTNREDQNYLFMDGPGILNFTISSIISLAPNAGSLIP